MLASFIAALTQFISLSTSMNKCKKIKKMLEEGGVSDHRFI
jgi:hypothetical protein